jgi:radical SAM superfamily enzyme YgiQ (UPF0313 family)
MPNQRIEKLKGLPTPARHLLNSKRIKLNKRIPGSRESAVTMITARGCPYNCKFCGNIYKKYYVRPKDEILAEIIDVKSAYGVSNIILLDENILQSESHLYDVCAVMKSQNITWTADARIDYYSDEKINAMIESGCVEIKYGVESGSNMMLSKMHKKITREQIEKVIMSTKERGLNTKAFLMYGYPGDNIETAHETVAMLSKLRQYIDRVNLFSFTPLPSSMVYRELEGAKVANFKKFTIYGQMNHWWGTEEQYGNMVSGYKVLQTYLTNEYQSKWV